MFILIQFNSFTHKYSSSTEDIFECDSPEIYESNHVNTIIRIADLVPVPSSSIFLEGDFQGLGRVCGWILPNERLKNLFSNDKDLILLSIPAEKCRKPHVCVIDK